ncbi:hypothetical protein TSAR_004387 [Trichomalopsis sarcophagae]|uniref:EFCAB10 C-terminal EF-hand domain-containing protein n=1 Tax=Trichomalopsis sarcophagae TaxID=543379 RepID=A0A232FGQ7_9HYME|nr:hypothetical protein TSAR_004387 [Trichomalopsis sarcophagae]
MVGDTESDSSLEIVLLARDSVRSKYIGEMSEEEVRPDVGESWKPRMNIDGADAKSAAATAEASERYLSARRIPEFFGFLMGHLVAERPHEPIGYLFDLLDKCALFRDGLVEPPLLFTPRHIESMYSSLDPVNRGYISLEQYAVGMKTLGIDCFAPNPMTCQCDPERVNKDAFVREAKRCLEKSLKEMIAKPRAVHESKASE